MNPISYDLLERKKAVLLEELSLIKSISKDYYDRRGEKLVQNALLHSMQNAIAAVIDSAQHIVSEKGATAESYSDAIDKLGVLGVLDRKFATEFSRVARLRNVMVHLYENINFEYIWSLLPKFVSDCNSFLKALEKI